MDETLLPKPAFSNMSSQLQNGSSPRRDLQGRKTLRWLIVLPFASAFLVVTLSADLSGSSVLGRAPLWVAGAWIIVFVIANLYCHQSRCPRSHNFFFHRREPP